MLSEKVLLVHFPPASEHPVQVPQSPSNFAPGIKTKFKEFSVKIWKNWTHWDQLIFHRGAKQKFSEYLPTIIDKIFDTNSSFHVK